jgi:hypothetical protein
MLKLARSVERRCLREAGNVAREVSNKLGNSRQVSWRQRGTSVQVSATLPSGAEPRPLRAATDIDLPLSIQTALDSA